MPAPAGTGLSRRSFLLRSAGLALVVYGAGRLGPLRGGGGARPVRRRPGRCSSRSSSQGGIDSVSVLAPTEDATYRRLRPKLALPPGTGDAVQRGPAAALAPVGRRRSPRCTREGKVSVMPAVGYEHPDQSHFVSRHFYEVGALDPQTTTGWLGRYLDRVGSPDNPLQGLALDTSLAPALAAGRVPVAAVDTPTDYNFWARDVWGDDRRADARRDRADRRRRTPRSERALAQVAGAAMHTGALRCAARRRCARSTDRRRVHAAGRLSRLGGLRLPRAARRARAMLAAGLPLRCVAITAPGDYDTHANQVETLGEPLKLACDALAAFQRDLEARGLADRVLIHVWSEFGRRAAENAEGTDHGAAGLGLLIGTRAAGPDDRRVPRPRRARRARQPARDVRLPRRLRRPARAVARDRGRRDHPRRRRASRGRSSSSEGAARRGAARSRLPRRPPRRAGADAGHRRRVDRWSRSRQSVARGEARDPALQPRRGRARPRRAAPRLGRRGRTVRVARDRGPGSSARRRWRLKPGKYRLWCDLPGASRRGDARDACGPGSAAVSSRRGGRSRPSGRRAAIRARGCAPRLSWRARSSSSGDELAGRAERVGRRRGRRRPRGRPTARRRPRRARTAPRGARRESSWARRSMAAASAGPAKRRVRWAAPVSGSAWTGPASRRRSVVTDVVMTCILRLSTPVAHRAFAVTSGPGPLSPEP